MVDVSSEELPGIHMFLLHTTCDIALRGVGEGVIITSPISTQQSDKPKHGSISLKSSGQINMAVCTQQHRDPKFSSIFVNNIVWQL